MWQTLLFTGTAALFLAWTLSALWQLRRVRRLPALTTLLPAGRPPSSVEPRIRCSIIVAARDEQERIEQTVGRLLAQRGVETEIIVLDDRSTDRTSDILRRLARENPRLQVKRVDALPDGWLGKCHACHLGATAATGEWILFTDADCWLRPDVIERAVRVAERDQADHVTLSPGTVLESVWARAWHLLFLTSLLNWISGVNRDRPKAHLGIGAFNLVRTNAYRQSGGYQALRLTVVDDIKLGLLLRRAGGRTRAFLGADDVECQWGGTVRGMMKVMEKNGFAALDYRLGLVLVGSLFALIIMGILGFGWLSGSVLGRAAALSPMTLAIPAVVLVRRLGWSWPCAVVMPFMFPVLLVALLNSTWVTLSQGGVRWRDTFYSLDTLRDGNVR